MTTLAMIAPTSSKTKPTITSARLEYISCLRASGEFTADEIEAIIASTDGFEARWGSERYNTALRQRTSERTAVHVRKPSMNGGSLF